MSYFSTTAIAKAQDHALKAYPLECCGVIVDGEYIALPNSAADPALHRDGDKDCPCQRCSFTIDPGELVKVVKGRQVEAYVHSHPDGPFYPSATDIQQQMISGVPWVIIATDGERVGEPVEFGDTLPVAPILGRRFMHYVNDCYSLVRDVFRLGRDDLAAQGIDWPFEPVTLPDMPREDGWWDKGDNFYLENFERAGFRRIEMSEARPGDAFLCKIGDKVTVPNHAGLLLGGNLIVHHLPGDTRVSRREPVGGWGRLAEMWLRFYPDLLEKNDA